MKTAVWRLAIVLFVCCTIVCGCAKTVKDKEYKLNWQDPSLWNDKDGMWQVTEVSQGLRFYKDKQPAHNSMCWMRLEKPLKRGQTIEITYRMQVPWKHVDLFMGDNCDWPARSEWDNLKEPLPDFAEVLSLGSIVSTDWQTLRRTITSDQEINTLGFLCWGWRWWGLDVDINTWMEVKEIKVLPAEGDPDWFAWEVRPYINERKIPMRSSVQDFFPFGVYLSLGSMHRVAEREGKEMWDLMDEIYGDLAERGMNFSTTVNFFLEEFDRVVELHRKHGLKLNPEIAEFDLRFNKDHDKIFKMLKEVVRKYRDSGIIAGWACGEEFQPWVMPALKQPHDIVHSIDPQNTLVSIHNKVVSYEIAGRTLDIRIAIFDIYPFFGYPHSGPVTPEASINYYEDEIDKCRRLLPQGASLWLCPQGQGEGGPVGKGGHFRVPTVAEIRLQTWAALAFGAQGFEWFVYHSEGTPEKLKFDGLRALDGSPTDRMIELTDLAKKLVPLGPTITKWQRSTDTAAETDNRYVRAYLFFGPEGEIYVVVYNRDAQKANAARVRVPFTLKDSVTDLVSSARIPVRRSGDKSTFEVSFRLGEGTIIDLGVKASK